MSDSKIDKLNIILGVDPGLSSTGIGVIQRTSDGWKYIHSGDVKTNSSQEMPIRLDKIYTLVKDSIDEYSPDCIAVESIFFAKNVKSAVQMAHGRGVALLAAHQSKIEVHEYSPLEIKQSVVGKGRASKDQVLTMVQLLLNIKKSNMSDHQSDALACALAHAYRSKLGLLPKTKKAPRKQITATTETLSDAKTLLAMQKRSKRKRRR